MVKGTGSSPFSPTASTSNTDLRSSAQLEKRGSKIRGLFQDLLGSESKKQREGSAISQSAAAAAAAAAQVTTAEEIRTSTDNYKAPRRRVRSMTISRASDAIDPAAVAAQGEEEWLKFMREQTASQASKELEHPQQVTALRLSAASRASTPSSSPKSASSSPKQSPTAAAAAAAASSPMLRQSGSLRSISRGSGSRDDIRIIDLSSSSGAQAAAAAAAAAPLVRTSHTLELCQENLRSIYTILLEKDKVPFNPQFLRQKESQILTLEGNKALKWTEQKIWSKENAGKSALLHILHIIREAFILDCFEFIPTEHTVSIPVVELLNMLRDNAAIGKILHRDRMIREEWIKAHYTSRFHKSLLQAELLLRLLKETKASRGIIIKELSKNQRNEIDQIKNKYITEQDCRARTLGGVLRPQILEIIARLDMTDVLQAFDYDSFLPVLKQIIFFEPDSLYGFNGSSPEMFEKYFATCENKFEGYLNYMCSIIGEDPKREHSALEHFIHTAKTPEVAKLTLPLSVLKSPDFVPCLREDLKLKLQDLFSSDAYVGCLNILTDMPEKILLAQIRGFAPMIQQLCLRAIELQKKRGIMSNHQAVELGKLVLEYTGKEPQWHKIPGILIAIVENFNL